MMASQHKIQLLKLQNPMPVLKLETYRTMWRYRKTIGSSIPQNTQQHTAQYIQIPMHGPYPSDGNKPDPLLMKKFPSDDSISWKTNTSLTTHYHSVNLPVKQSRKPPPLIDPQHTFAATPDCTVSFVAVFYAKYKILILNLPSESWNSYNKCGKCKKYAYSLLRLRTRNLWIERRLTFWNGWKYFIF